MISTFEQQSPLIVLELYVEIDVASSLFLSVAPSFHSTIAFDDRYTADVCSSNEDEDCIRDIVK